MRDSFESEQRLLAIERVLEELWCIRDAKLLSVEHIAVRLAEMRGDACREALTLLLDKQAEIVDAALRVGQRSLIPQERAP